MFCFPAVTRRPQARAWSAALRNEKIATDNPAAVVATLAPSRQRSPAHTRLRTQLRAVALLIASIAATPVQAALTLSASVNPQPARPGEMLDVEFTVGNTDAVSRTGVVLTLVYPAGLNSVAPGNFGGSCPPSFCDPGETVTWNLGTLAAGRFVTVDLPPFVSAATTDGTVITFNATVTDGTLQVANASASTLVRTGTLYDIGLRDSADPVASGALLTYQIAFGYREEALAPASNTLRFPLPGGTTFVSATGGGSFNSGAVQWNLGSMAPGEGGTRLVTVAVTAGDNEVIQATAQIFNSAAPANEATAAALTVVDMNWPLSVTLDANADPARPGEQLNVQMVVTNHDAITRNAILLRVRYPDGVSAVANANINGGSCPPSFCDPGEQVSWTITSLGAGRSVTLELPSAVAAATPDGTLLNFFAMLSDANGGNASAIDSVRVRTLPHYDLALRDSADPVAPLQAVTYKLTYAYREEAPAPADSRLRFRLPGNVAYLSSSDDGVFDGAGVTWDVGTLHPGDGGSREVVIQASGSDGTVLRAAAEIFNAGNPIEQAAAEGLTVVHSLPSISVDVDANADPARPGELLNVQAVVINHDAIARTMTLRMRYPEGVASTAQLTGSCPPSFCDPGEIVTYNIGSVAPGKSMTVELAPFVAASAADGLLINFYAIVNDTVGGNASSIDSVRVRSNPSFDLAIRESADPVRTGDLLVYKLSFGYREEAPAPADATLSVRLPPGTAFAGASGAAVLVGDHVEWSLGIMNPGDGGFRELTVQVLAPAAATLPLSARIFAVSDPVEQAAAEALTTVDSTPLLALQIDANADPARNEMLNVQYVVTNRDVVGHNVTLRARYPDGVTAVANSNLGWSPAPGCPPSFCDPGEIVTVNVGTVDPGQSVTVELNPSVPLATADGQLINFFAIATDTGGNVASASDQLHVHMASRFDLMIRDSADSVSPGAALTYKLSFGYRADAAAIADGRLRFRLPAGTTFISATGGGTQSGDHLQWSLGQMSPGDGGVRSVTVLVDAADSSVLQAQAEVFDATRPFRQAQAEALTVVDAAPALSLSVNATPGPVLANQPLHLEMLVTNNDTVARTVALRLRYPDGLFSLNVINTTPTGSCPPSFCDPGEMITWNLGVLGAGQSTLVTVLPTVHSAVVNGQLINFFAIATDTAGGIATGIDSVRIGTCANDDADCDGIADNADNCVFVDNSNQRDTDGDGIGNACDADLSQDCRVNFVDLGILRTRFFGNDPHADFDGNGTVNFADLLIMKNSFFQAPGPSGVPNACAAARHPYLSGTAM